MSLITLASLAELLKDHACKATLEVDEKEVYVTTITTPTQKVFRGRGPTLASSIDAALLAPECHPRVFVHGSINERGKRGTFCPDCIPDEVRKNLGESFVDTWEIHSDGWMKPIVCQVCKLSIPVIIDGVEEDE